MAVFDNFPYTNNHELNLDWIIKEVIKVLKASEDISTSAEIAVTAAENAAQSELNAKDSEDASAEYYTLTSQLVGKPLAANTVAEMTDTTTIYIYTGDEAGYEPGHWYYYDGNDWVDGGLYGGDGGISTNARNLLKYILERVAYTEAGMDVYVDALYQALAESGGGGGGTTTYMIINALTNVTNSNDATGADEGDSYTATLTADSGYNMDAVSITMGGIDITSTAYDSLTGVITITSVTGDVIITATAVSDGWVNNVKTITSDMLVNGRIYGTSYPYWGTFNGRISYVGTDVNVSTDYTYVITYTTTRVDTTNIGVQVLNSTAAEAVIDQDTFNSSDKTDLGWQNSGYQYTPSATDALLWFTFKATSTDTLPEQFPEINITRTAVI